MDARSFWFWVVIVTFSVLEFAGGVVFVWLWDFPEGLGKMEAGRRRRVIMIVLAVAAVMAIAWYVCLYAVDAAFPTT